MAKILVLHGPNLNLLGAREPEIYGHLTLVDINNQLAAQAQAAGHELVWFQSNAEHELVGRIQQTRDDGTALILFNPAAFTHTSIALRDALSAADKPAIEVHISDIKKREKFRHHSMTAGACRAMISGKGFPGYVAALKLMGKYL